MQIGKEEVKLKGDQYEWNTEQSRREAGCVSADPYKPQEGT